MTISKVVCAALLTLACASAAAEGAEQAVPTQAIERGRYVVATSGCNDCHTPGYPESGGTLPVNEWLTGAPVGFQGPWGTTYPTNLRLLVQQISEQEWLAKARKPMRPPMPWFSMRDMNDADLQAIYHFLRSLGPSGKPAPAYAEPGEAVTTPYIDFMPKNLRRRAGIE